MFHSPNLSINSENHLVIGQHDTVELAKKFGTPLYVLDEDLMRDNCRAYKNAIDTYYDGHGLVLFASKALCTMYTGRLVAEEGLGADVVSGGELYTLYKAGFPMEKVFFHGNNKTPDEIELALNCGVGHIVVDNKYELELLNRIANEKNVNQRILFRIKPGIDAHTHDFVKTGQIDSKFGVALENGEAYEIHKLALSMSNIQIDGVHCHIGSQIFDVEPFCEAAKVMIGFIADLYDKLGIKVNILNLGGGFGIKYTATDDPIAPSEYIHKVTNVVKELAQEKGIDLPFLVFEPGRSIVASAGITLYTVGCVKEIENVRTYVSIDGGMCDNPRYILYGSKYTAVLANNASAEPVAPVTIAGKCCESGDLIQEHVMMPQIHVGDTLAVLATGAYNYSMSSNYNRIPRPPIVMVSGNEAKIIVKRETYDDLIKNDVLEEVRVLQGVL
ncbi:MAG: diaminopimelate decarboxylase [Acutalibacteraceae bacterium]|nr:diaminopimelate decarboxylase [Acutalibacteraceae bacterium]